MKLQYGINVSAQGIARVAQMTAGLIATVAVARVLGAAALGKYAYVLSFLGVAVGAADSGTTAVLARGVATHKHDDRDSYVGTFLLLRLALATAVAAAGASVALIAAPRDMLVPLLAGLLTLPFLAARFFEPVFQVTGRPWYSVHVAVGYSAMLVTGTLAAVHLPHDALRWALACYIVAGTGYAIHAAALARRVVRPRFRYDRTMGAEILRLAAPVGISALFALLNTRMPIFLLERLRTAAEVGFYGAAARFLDVAVAVIVTATAPLLPIFARLAIERSQALKHAYGAIVQFISLACTPVAVLTPLVAEPLVRLLFGAEYTPAAKVVSILAWNGLLICYGLSGTAVLLTVGRVGLASLNTAVAACMNVALCLWWIPRFGIEGAAYAALCAEGYLVLVVVALVRSRIGAMPQQSRLLALVGANAALGLLVYGTPSPLRVPVTAIALALYVTAARFFDLVPRNLADSLRPAGTIGDPVAARGSAETGLS